MLHTESRYRFSVLAHDFPFEHWDLLLESPRKSAAPAAADDRCLLTWRLLSSPLTGRDCSAERLADHRRLYLDYEGPVSDDRGVVQRLETAFYRPIGWDEDGGVFELELVRSRLGDRLSLIRDHDDHWTCRFFRREQ